jgi:hypothetical protein
MSSPAIKIPTAPVPLNWLDPKPGVVRPMFPLGPPADFGGAIIPNPDNIRALPDTESPGVQLSGGKLSTENFTGKAPIKTVGDPPKTLPADFAAWDKPPATLPAEFSNWDQPSKTGEAKPSTASHITNEFLSGLGIGSKEDAKNFFEHPINTMMDSFKGQGELAIKARDAYKRGDYTNAVIHGLNYLVPFIGQQTDKAGEQMQKGDIAGGLARTAGVAGSIIAGAKTPEVTGRMPALSDIIKAKAAKITDAARETAPAVARNPASELPAAFQPLPKKAPAVPGTVDLPFRAPETRSLADLNGSPTAAPPKVTPKAVESQLNESLGGQPLQKNVPLRQQLPAAQKATAATKLPDGFTAVESSALRGYKYNPATREFESITKDGRHYIHGDVSPEEAQAFEQADSKGKAWSQLKSQNPLVAKVLDGKRTAIVKSGPSGATPQDVAPGQDLTPALKDSLKNVMSLPKDAAGKPIRYVYRARDVGEEGVPLTNEHASATSDAAQAKQYAKAGQRSQQAGQVVRIDLSKLSPKDYVVKQHPDGPLWIQFTRPLTESEVSHYAGAGKTASK